MFLVGKRTIPIKEYVSSSVCNANNKRAVLVKPNKLQNYIEISSQRLAYGMSRSILSYDPTDIDLYAQAFMSFVGLQLSVDSRSQHLDLVNGFRSKYRDFSRSSRTGEIAQGIAYLFAKDVLGHVNVVDYNGYLASQGIPTIPSEEPHPDFILYGSRPNAIDLIESKGICLSNKSNSVKKDLRKTMKQCHSGKNHILSNTIGWNVSAEHGVLVSFAEAGDSWDTQIHYCDPNSGNHDKLFHWYPLFCYHYASWFAFLGDWRNAISLVSENRLVESNQETDTFEYGGNKYVEMKPYLRFPYWFSPMIWFYWDEIRPMRFGLAQEVYYILRNGQPESSIYEQPPKHKTISNSEAEVFCDGTILQYKEGRSRR